MNRPKTDLPCWAPCFCLPACCNCPVALSEFATCFIKIIELRIGKFQKMQLQQEKQTAKLNLLRKCGLLAHTSAAFLKNCCTEKLFVCLRLIIGNNALRNSIRNFPALLLMTILRHRFLNLSVYNQFRCFSCLLKRLLHGFLIALRKLPQNPVC